VLKINHSYILSLKDDWDGEISTEKAVAHNAHEAEAHISMYTQTAPSVVDLVILIGLQLNGLFLTNSLLCLRAQVQSLHLSLFLWACSASRCCWSSISLYIHLLTATNTS